METEIIVADNNSTDATADIARGHGAIVAFEPINQISRSRNAGAKVATGDWFLFTDADCEMSAASVRELLARIDEGTCAGGGCLVALDEGPPVGRFFVGFWNRLSITFKWAAGCFVFCRADAFREIGGFSLELFASEEVKFSADLKRWAKSRKLKFVILRSPHLTSGRKFSLFSGREWARIGWRFFCAPRKSIRERQDLHYDGRRR